MLTAIKNAIKGAIFPPGKRGYTVWTGPARKLRIWVDPANSVQTILGLYEREIAGIFKRYIREAASFIDIGASAGYYTILAAHLRPGIRCVSCEARPEMEAEFLKAIELNGLAGSKDFGWCPKFIGPNDTKLDDIAGELRRPLVVKIDVDGGEVDVLRSGTQTMQDPGTVFVIETHSAQLEQDCISILTQHGYRCKVVPNGWWRIIVHDQRPIEHNRWLLATKA